MIYSNFSDGFNRKSDIFQVIEYFFGEILNIEREEKIDQFLKNGKYFFVKNLLGYDRSGATWDSNITKNRNSENLKNFLLEFGEGKISYDMLNLKLKEAGIFHSLPGHAKKTNYNLDLLFNGKYLNALAGKILYKNNFYNGKYEKILNEKQLEKIISHAEKIKKYKLVSEKFLPYFNGILKCGICNSNLYEKKVGNQKHTYLACSNPSCINKNRLTSMPNYEKQLKQAFQSLNINNKNQIVEEFEKFSTNFFESKIFDTKNIEIEKIYIEAQSKNLYFPLEKLEQLWFEQNTLLEVSKNKKFIKNYSNILKSILEHPEKYFENPQYKKFILFLVFGGKALAGINGEIFYKSFKNL